MIWKTEKERLKFLEPERNDRDHNGKQIPIVPRSRFVFQNHFLTFVNF